MNRDLYEAPAIIVVEVNTKGVLCDSGTRGFRSSYGTASELDGTEQVWE